MEARATLGRSQSSTRSFVLLIAALLAALLLGGAGGYTFRGLSIAAPSTTTTTHRPFVVETAPYSSPAPSPIPEPTRDPNGFAVPI